MQAKAAAPEREARRRARVFSPDSKSVIGRQRAARVQSDSRAPARNDVRARAGTTLAVLAGRSWAASHLPYVQGEVVSRYRSPMNPEKRQDTYTMPLKQLLKLLETTADDPAKARRLRRTRQDARTGARPEPELDYVRY